MRYGREPNAQFSRIVEPRDSSRECQTYMTVRSRMLNLVHICVQQLSITKVGGKTWNLSTVAKVCMHAI